MLVSIVIPTRDRPRLLAEAIEGVKSQTYQDIEVVLVDDGSSDENAKINQSLLADANLRYQYIYLDGASVSRRGPGSSRNIGIQKSTGDLVGFCDDDDHWCEPEYLSTMMAAFAADPELDMTFANQIAKTGDKVSYDVWMPKLASIVQSRLTQPDSLVEISRAECLSQSGDFGHLNTCIFRKPLLTEIGNFNTFRYSSDQDMFVRAADRSRKIMYLHKPVSVHNIPDHAKGQNVTTRLNLFQKNVTLFEIAVHLLGHCQSPEARAYARELASTSCRHLCQQEKNAGAYKDALLWAKLAWSWNPTAKWSLYLMLIWMKSIVSPR